jgi:soluble lytic murein transglycosylase-like protein
MTVNLTQIILSAAKSAHVSGAILLAICTHESGLRNVRVARDGVSPTYGVCQIKGETAKMLGYEGNPENLMNPAINAKYAALYLKYQYDRYDRNFYKAVAAYNAGKYNESQIVRGCPRNLQYVKHVQSKLADHMKNQLSCKIARNAP